MKIKTKFGYIEIESILIIVIITSLISNTLFKFLYYFFACYLFIFFHELMHITIGSIFGKNLIKIKLSISGVCAIFEKNSIIKKENMKNILIYLAGPSSNFILALVFRNSNMIRDINIFLGLLNLIPIYPLDGYNILFNLLELLKLKKVKIIINNISKIFLIILSLISIILMIKYYSFSLSIFTIYLFVIKNNSEKLC